MIVITKQTLSGYSPLCLAESQSEAVELIANDSRVHKSMVWVSDWSETKTELGKPITVASTGRDYYQLIIL